MALAASTLGFCIWNYNTLHVVLTVVILQLVACGFISGVATTDSTLFNWTGQPHDVLQHAQRPCGIVAHPG